MQFLSFSFIYVLFILQYCKAITELEVLNIITQCLFKTVKNEPFDMVHAFQLPTSKTEKCFTWCIFLKSKVVDENGKFDGDLARDSLTLTYGQGEKVAKVAKQCAEELPVFDVKSSDCNVVDPIIQCYDKYFSEYEIDRTKRI